MLLLLPITLLESSFSIGPNVLPSSVLILITGSFVYGLTFSLLSHHVTYTLFPCASAATCALFDTIPFELLRFILSPHVLPPSVEALKNTSQSPSPVVVDVVDIVLLDHHTT